MDKLERTTPRMVAGARNRRITVSEWMSSPVHTVEADTSVADAYNLMMQKGIRRLPVVKGKSKRLVGLVTLGDLREARPSSATSLSIYELNYLLARLTVGQVMTHNPYTVSPGTPIQQAALVMLERKVSGLPVVNEANTPVGILTESDIFRLLIDQGACFAAQYGEPGLVATLIGQRINR